MPMGEEGGILRLVAPETHDRMACVIFVHLMHTVLSLDYWSTSHLLSPGHTVHGQVCWMELKRNGPHREHPVQLKKSGAFTLSHFSYGRNSRQRSFLTLSHAVHWEGRCAVIIQCSAFFIVQISHP